MPFIVLRRDSTERSVPLCLTDHEFMASDAVLEYASNYFRQMNPQWEGEGDPAALEEDEWPAVGPRMEHQDLNDIHGNLGSLTRVILEDGGDVEFYYSTADTYVKEQMLKPSKVLSQFADVLPPEKRGGDMIRGALAEQCQQAGLLGGENGARRSVEEFL